MDNKLIQVFDNMRFPLVVGVVFIHSFGYGGDFVFSDIDFSNLSTLDIFNLFRVCISHVLMHVCVPLFFFISGYMYFLGKDFSFPIYVNKTKRRVRSLFVPYIIWNTVGILWTILVIYSHEGVDNMNTFIYSKDILSLYWDSESWNLDRTNWWGGGNSFYSTMPGAFVVS